MSDVKRYCDIAEVMEPLGVKRVAKDDVRNIAAKLRTVRRAAIVHRLVTEDVVALL